MLQATRSCSTQMGVTKATNTSDEEFGESRLLEALKTHSHFAADALLQTVVCVVHQFGSSERNRVTARCGCEVSRIARLWSYQYQEAEQNF